LYLSVYTVENHFLTGYMQTLKCSGWIQVIL
jgi:hypothetical protein